MNRNFIELLQVSVGTRDELSRGLTDSEWNEIYRLAESQRANWYSVWWY